MESCCRHGLVLDDIAASGSRDEGEGCRSRQHVVRASEKGPHVTRCEWSIRGTTTHRSTWAFEWRAQGSPTLPKMRPMAPRTQQNQSAARCCRRRGKGAHPGRHGDGGLIHGEPAQRIHMAAPQAQVHWYPYGLELEAWSLARFVGANWARTKY
jgi:hypothetical protein